MTNTPSTSPELSKLSPEERNTLQDIINDLEGNSPKVGGMDIYILAAYRFVRDHDPYDETKDTLRAIKKGLDNKDPKYTREYIMRYLGITIPDRAAPAEALVDLFAASQARRKKMIKKPRASVLAVLDPQQVEPTIVKPAIVKVNPIQATVVKSKSSKKKVSPKRELPETIENEVPEEESDKDNWLVSQKWTRIAEAPKKAVEKIAQIEKTPEEKERHDALIAYLGEDFLPSYYKYFPNIADISFDRYGCPIILQAYREKLSGMDQKIANLILDKVGDFIFKKKI